MSDDFIYIVSEGPSSMCLDDYRVIGVFDNIEQAFKLIKKEREDYFWIERHKLNKGGRGEYFNGKGGWNSSEN